jgi:hypothetical protein
MNLESAAPKKGKVVTVQNDDLSMDDFDFKPITSGLGFHHSRPQEVKPVFTDKALPTPVMTPRTAPVSPMKKEASVYQNDLSLFYNANSNTAPTSMAAPITESVAEVRLPKTYPRATRTQRTTAYLLDLFVVAGVLSIVLTIMARTISMYLVEVWSAYPHEITPLVLVLRSIVTLANFLSLGLFSWFDLQNKITGSKVVRVG